MNMLVRSAAVMAATLAMPAVTQPVGRPPSSVIERAHQTPAPARRPGEGKGPFRKLVIRGVTIIDGSGAPPNGPLDIVIEGNRITDIIPAGTPGVPTKPGRAPRDADYELDAAGMFVLPGFIDMHVHGSGDDKAPDLSYAYKLWLAHGVTSVRGVELANFEVSLSERARSERNEIVAPHIYVYQRPGQGAGWKGAPTYTPEAMRGWVRWAAKQGIDGVKIEANANQGPEAMAALLDEAPKQGLGTVAHIRQIGAPLLTGARMGELGLDTITHFYGHFESLLKNGTVQDWRYDYNYSDEQARFLDVADLVEQSVDPGSAEWWAYLHSQKERGVVFDPTLSIYNANRDVMRARNADWHDRYTMPQLWAYYMPDREKHGSYWFDWTTGMEVKWRNFYRKFEQLVNDYKNIGGRVTTGSDSGFIFQTYGFGYIQELELLQEAGFNPSQVIQAATYNGALTLYEPKGRVAPMGLVRAGKVADLVIVRENPLQNLKTLYGTGALRLNDATGKWERVGGISYTVKDGIIYDAKQLLRDVAEMVASEKKRLGLPVDRVPRP